ncbi:MAG TPA: nucleotide-binding protein [Oscillatoriales bacterium UBA8482]|nr:nucleotide-binding protein [Oscillatoriales bacterium UBA8482]
MEFNLTGTIQNVEIKDGKPKVITLITSLGLLLIKISKQARIIGISDLAPGDQVKVTGQKKQDFKTGKIKLKATRVFSTSEPISTLTRSYSISEKTDQDHEISSDVITFKPPQLSPVKPAKILICQKSDCRKRGSDQVCSLLQKELAQRGLEERVTIQKTGCLKKCKSGPNIVMLPDKTHYNKVESKQIPVLIDKHF